MSWWNDILKFIERWRETRKGRTAILVEPYQRNSNSTGTVGANLQQTHPNSRYDIHAEGNKVPHIPVQKLNLLDKMTKGIFGDDAKPAIWDSGYGNNNFKPFDFGGKSAFDFSAFPPNSGVILGKTEEGPNLWPKGPAKKHL